MQEGKISGMKQINLQTLSARIDKAAQASHSEEDLKMKLEPLLKKAFSDVGADVSMAEYEKHTGSTLKARRMDVVYGFLVIEYKAPGKLGRKQTVYEAQQQLIDALSSESKQSSDEEGFLEKAVGVSLDGERIMFVRFSRSGRHLPTPVPIQTEQATFFGQEAPLPGFQVQGPYPVTPESLLNLLIFVRSAARRPLTAEYLAKVFGPSQQVAQQAVAELYSAIMRGQRRSALPRVAAFFREWDRIFGTVYGEQLDKANEAAAETAKAYNMAAGVRLKQLLFSIHTFYALLMKLIAIELLALQRELNVTSFVEGLSVASDSELKLKLQELESGAGFQNKGIDNFLEADFFSWYLDAWNPKLCKALRGMIRALAEFEPATPVLEPDWTRDLLQKLYELIVPKKLRHALGEYYTPDWLAGYLVDKSGYDGAPGMRFLDPACGSGTFLVQALDRAKRKAEALSTDPKKAGKAMLADIVGFDLNPLAVLAARTNYLIAFAPLLRHVCPLSIPVYLCDSIVPPDSDRAKQTSLLSQGTVVFATQEHEFAFPLGMKDKTNIEVFTGLVSESLRAHLSSDTFVKRLNKVMALSDREAQQLVDVYAQIKKLDDEGRNGIWAHYIKNAFAPVYVGQFDYVIGNPPWIRWGYLSVEYRKRTLAMWENYGLFSLKGHAARLGGGEKDFSMLFTYACADRYLKEQGILAFVITHEVFKSKGAGEGFRDFRLGRDRGSMPVKVLWMEDMVHLQPFHAANKTCIFALEKGAATKYPVPTVEWKRKAGTGSIPAESNLNKVLARTIRTELLADPVDPVRAVSSWQTATPSDRKAFQNLKGKGAYDARLGARVEPYGVFWLRVKEVRPDGMLVVENQHDRGKRKISHVENAIEPDLMFPAVAGGDITRFGIKQVFPLLLPHDPKTRKGFDEDWLSTELPHTYGYLVQFRDILISRAAYQKYFFKEVKRRGKIIKREPTGPFYSMYNISGDSFAPYRVTWKRMASKMSVVVLSRIQTDYGMKPVISTDTTSFIPVRNRVEAHYLCAILSSELVDRYIRSFSSGGRGFGAPSVMQNLGIPAFDVADKLHQSLADLSMKAHDGVKKGADISGLETNINKSVKKLWNIKH